MTICFGKSYPFGLLCLSFVNIYQFVRVGFEVGILGYIVLVPDDCLSIYFPFAVLF